MFIRAQLQINLLQMFRETNSNSELIVKSIVD